MELKKSCSKHFLLNLLVFFVAVLIKDNPDSEGAAGTLGDILSNFNLLKGDLELISTWTRIEEHATFSIKIKIFNLNLIINFS